MQHPLCHSFELEHISLQWDLELVHHWKQQVPKCTDCENLQELRVEAGNQNATIAFLGPASPGRRKVVASGTTTWSDMIDEVIAFLGLASPSRKKVAAAGKTTWSSMTCAPKDTTACRQLGGGGLGLSRSEVHIDHATNTRRRCQNCKWHCQVFVVRAACYVHF